MKFLQDLLSEKRAMLYFAQPSTRTFLSFYAACQILGVQAAEVRDAHTSSEVKGESQEDSVRTFSSYFDMIIMRHPQGGLPNASRGCCPAPTGNLRHQRGARARISIPPRPCSTSTPCSAAWKNRRGGLEGARIAFVGDLLRGRTVRSLSLLLTHCPG